MEEYNTTFNIDGITVHTAFCRTFKDVIDVANSIKRCKRKRLECILKSNYSADIEFNNTDKIIW